MSHSKTYTFSLDLKQLSNRAICCSCFLLIFFFPTASIGQESPPPNADVDEITNEVKELNLQKTPGETNIRERVIGTKYTEKFSLHNKLNYAIVGENDAKLQFSFKYRLVDDFNLYLVYGNLIFWDIYKSSQPYRDINFNPEVFYRIPGWSKGPFSIDLGYWHNSNGKDQEESRSWDRLYLRFNTYIKYKGIEFYWMTTAYKNTGTGVNNNDIRKYLGFWETAIYATRLLGNNKENLDLEFILKSGEDGRPFAFQKDKGSILIGAKFTLGIPRMNPYFYIQYFNGYGESLLDYDKRTKEIRAGIAFFY